MKYPAVLLFRHAQHAKEIDNWIETNPDKLDCAITITGDIHQIPKLFSGQFMVLITYGTDLNEYLGQVDRQLVPRLNNRWIHLSHPVADTNVQDFNRRINGCYIHYVIGDREKTRPAFSAITTTYNSYEKINRPFESLKTQTMRDWEWVIVDDSPDDAHFQFLRDKFKRHPQIRLYRRDRNSGSIGNVKNEAVALARGKYTVELDHDDELAPTTLADATKAFDTDPKVGFVYMDFINIYEPAAPGAPAENFKYSDFISFGYGGYYSQYMDGQWRYVYITPNVNNITASALIALPNHPRMWRTSLLQTRLGNYSEYLPVCDDLEILLRTFADPDIQTVKIPKVGYVQYMNRDNNNFSLIRNEEINRLGPQHISPMFYAAYNMHKSFLKRNAYEDESFLVNHSQIWKRPPEPIYVHKYANRHFHPDYTRQLCVIGPLDPHLVQKLQNLPTTTDVLWLTNTIPINQMWQLLEQHNLQTKVKCYCLKDTATKEELQRFFLRLYRTNTLPYEFTELNRIGELDQPIQDDTPKTTDAVPPEKITQQPQRVFAARHEIINAHTTRQDRYLEIGVETGYTFRNVHFAEKRGVDPSPNTTDPNLNRLIFRTTSDVFFERCPGYEQYDVVFVDGMHHLENVARDINNAIRHNCTVANAKFRETSPLKVFLDDVLPLNEQEQVRVPRKHKWEDGVLKYDGEPWTGDVWKVMYWLLQNRPQNVRRVWTHANYRGVAMLEIAEWREENGEFILEKEAAMYTFRDDFEKYREMLSAYAT